MSFNPNIGVLPPNSPFAWNANRDALNVGKNFSTLGSYWTEQMSDDNKSQKFLDSYSPNDITYVIDTTGDHIYKCVIADFNKTISLVEVTNEVSLDFEPSNIVSDSTGKVFYKIQIDSNEKTVALYKLGTEKPDGVEPNNFVYDKEGNICWKLVVDNEDKSGVYFKFEFKGRPKTGGRTHAKILSNISLRTNGLSKLGNAKNNLINDPYNIYVTNGKYEFKESYVRQQLSRKTANSYVISFENIKETTRIFSSDSGSTGFSYNPSFTKSLNRQDELLSDYYTYIYFSQGIELLKIYTDPTVESGLKSETLLPGFDFLQFKNCIVFPKTVNPYDLFKDNTIYFDGRYLSTAKESESLYKGICNIEHVPCGLPAQLTANYINGSTQSPKDFELMLNSLVGTPILIDGPAKLVHTKDAQGRRNNIYYLNIKKNQLSKNVGLVCFGDWSNVSSDNQTNTCYVFKNIISGKSFVVKSQAAYNWLLDNIFTAWTTIPQNYVFNSPIKILSNIPPRKVKDSFKSTIYNKNTEDFVEYYAPIFNVRTLFPSLEKSINKKYLDNVNSSGNISSVIDSDNSNSYWSDDNCPLYKGNSQKLNDFKTYVSEIYTGTGHSEGEIIVGNALPNALYICLSLPVLEELYNAQMIESEYFFNKFPSFKSFVYFIVKTIKRFHPLGYVPMIIVSGTTSEVKYNDYDSKLDTSTYQKFTVLTDIDTYDNIDDIDTCPFNKGKYADYTVTNLPELLK